MLLREQLELLRGQRLDSGKTVPTFCFYHIRVICLDRQYIADVACKILVQALVASRLDYGNVTRFDSDIY